MKERKNSEKGEFQIKHYFWKFLKITAAVGLGVVALKFALHELKALPA